VRHEHAVCAGRRLTELSLVPRHELPPLEPPKDLTEHGKEIWRGVVACFRPDWFQGAEAILADYCQTAVTERQIAGVITECGVQDERWPELVRLHCNVTSSLANLGTKLRMTPQATRNKSSTKHVSLVGTPPLLDNVTEPDDPAA
jgi:hypothetical protein